MTKLTPAQKAHKKVKLKSVSFLKRKLDKIFSEYIRRRDEGQCFTCPTQRDWKEMQNGHFVSRSANSLRYDERNCNCQCPADNIFKHGNMPAYAVALQKKYGPNILKELLARGKEIKQFTRAELEALIEKYQQKVKDLDDR